MFIEERHREILRLLSETGRIALADIQEKFQVSVDSARRDLRILEGKGLLKRTHGGAIPIVPRGRKIPEAFTHREITTIKPNYMAIARHAVKMIEKHDVVHITSGSVGYFMVQQLPRDFEFTVVCHSIILADVLRTYSNVTTIMLGGVINSKGHCQDQLTIDMLSHIRCDKAFITSACISVDFGASIQSSQSVAMIRAIMASAKINIGLYPNEKIERESILQICPFKSFDIIITDWDVVEDDLLRMTDTAVEIIICTGREQETI